MKEYTNGLPEKIQVKQSQVKEETEEQKSNLSGNFSVFVKGINSFYVLIDKGKLLGMAFGPHIGRGYG